MVRPQYYYHRLLIEAETPMPPSNTTKSGGSYPNDANFDGNMVIILAALVCSLICALGLNSIVRCALRCGQRFAFDNPAGAAVRLASSGLKKDELGQIPVAVYRSGLNIPATDCPICLGEFAEGESVRILPKCNHGFHVKCIDTWLVLHSSCPTCRQLLFEHPTISNAEEVAGRV